MKKIILWLNTLIQDHFMEIKSDLIYLPSFLVENLKNLNKNENSSCSKVPDVGIQNDCIWTTITTQQTNKKGLSFLDQEIN